MNSSTTASFSPSQILLTVLALLLAGGIIYLWYKLNRTMPKKGISKSTEEKCLHTLASGDVKGAFELYRAIVTEGVAGVSAYIALGALFRANREPERALRLFETLLMRRDLPKDTLRLILGELIRLARITGKVFNLDRCLSFISKSYDGEEILYLEAVSFTGKGEPDLAQKKYEQYAKISGESVSKELAFLYVKQAEKSEQNAHKHLKQAIKADSLSHIAHLSLLKYLFLNKQDHDAALKLAGEIIDKALMRTKEDLRLLEDVYYTYGEFDRLKNVLLRNVAQGGTNPTVYLFLESYYKKIGDDETAKEVLRTFLLEHKAAVVIKKAYAKLIKDEVLSALFLEEPIYKCVECGASMDGYLHICPVCGGLETVNYN